MDTTEHQIERNIAAMVVEIAQGYFPDLQGRGLELRQRIHQTIDLCDQIAHRTATIRGEVSAFLAAHVAPGSSLRERASTIDEILRIEEGDYRGSKGPKPCATWLPERRIFRLRPGVTEITDEALIGMLRSMISSSP